MRVPRLFPAVLLSLLISVGCAASGHQGAHGPEEGDLLRFSGQVVFVPIEGGFFGLVADDGRRFDPGGLPDPFRRDGLRVKVTGRLVEPSVGFHMWGARIEIRTIEKE